MDDLEARLSSLTLAPYIIKATALIGISRRSGSNMFRHQLSTMAILLDYKIVDPVLLKASVIHDLFEDAPHLPGVSEQEIAAIDPDGPAVAALVREVSRRLMDGGKEPKATYLLRIMREGSPRARLLKLADRISNITALGFVHDVLFVERYLAETRAYILPYAENVNRDMYIELSDLIASRERLVPLLRQHLP
jgi:GTP pyrophosphokinase